MKAQIELHFFEIVAAEPRVETIETDVSCATELASVAQAYADWYKTQNYNFHFVESEVM